MIVAYFPIPNMSYRAQCLNMLEETVSLSQPPVLACSMKVSGKSLLASETPST